MVRARCAWVMIAAVCAACGSRTPPGGQASVTAAGGAIDAGIADAGPPDAGTDASVVAAFPSDAGLADIGVAPCQAMIARFLTCPNLPEDSKLQMAAAARRWREEAATSVQARESVAARCLEMARLSEQMLLGLGC